jgi:hypothetical protein
MGTLVPPFRVPNTDRRDGWVVSKIVNLSAEAICSHTRHGRQVKANRGEDCCGRSGWGRSRAWKKKGGVPCDNGLSLPSL